MSSHKILELFYIQARESSAHLPVELLYFILIENMYKRLVTSFVSNAFYTHIQKKRVEKYIHCQTRAISIRNV